MNKRIVMTVTCLFVLSMAVVASACATQQTKEVDDGVVTTTESVMGSEDQVMTIDNLMIPFTTDDVISRSDIIVMGKVVEILPPNAEGRFVETEDGLSVNTEHVYTYVIIEAERYFYGQSQTEYINVRLDGGRLSDSEGRAPDLVLIDPDEAVLDLGEVVVLCLKRPNYEAYHEVVRPSGIGEDYYLINFGKYGKYTLTNGDVITRHNKDTGEREQLKISELEQKIASIHGAE